MTLDECDALFAKIRAESHPSVLQDLFLNLLATDYSVTRIGLGRGSIFWRGRPCGPGGYANVRDVTYPQPHLAGLNRLSDLNQPRFYASARRETALAEQAACRDGQYVHLLGAWVKYGHEIRVLVLGEQHHVYKMGYWRMLGVDPDGALSRSMNAMPRDKALCAIYIDAFLGSVLSDPLAHQSDYVRSRALLAAITSKYPVDAVFYPSVKDAWGVNVVITPEALESHMVYCASRVVRVDRCREFGVMETSILRQAAKIGPDGEFEWQNDAGPDRELLFGLTKEEYEFALHNQCNQNALLDLKTHVRLQNALSPRAR
jgi:hypothetical protein